MNLLLQLIEVIGSFLERPLIKKEFEVKFIQILHMLAKEIKTVQVRIVKI